MQAHCKPSVRAAPTLSRRPCWARAWQGGRHPEADLPVWPCHIDWNPKSRSNEAPRPGARAATLDAASLGECRSWLRTDMDLRELRGGRYPGFERLALDLPANEAQIPWMSQYSVIARHVRCTTLALNAAVLLPTVDRRTSYVDSVCALRTCPSAYVDRSATHLRQGGRSSSRQAAVSSSHRPQERAGEDRPVTQSSPPTAWVPRCERASQTSVEACSIAAEYRRGSVLACCEPANVRDGCEAAQRLSR